MTDKIELGEIVLRELTRKKSEKLHPALLWALGRLGSRQPAYGPLNTTIPVRHVESWIESLIAIDPPGTSHAANAWFNSAEGRGIVIEISPKRSVNSRCDTWNRNPRPQHFVTLLDEGGSLDRDEEAAVFGDSLPLGIRLVRG